MTDSFALSGRRHIPIRRISEDGCQSFDEALNSALLPNDTYDIEKWLFVPNAYLNYRYILGTRGEKPLICVGINPSTARPDALDPTLKSVQRIALNNGFDSFLMLNVTAQRATDPNDMEPELYMPMHRENLRALEYAVSLSEAPVIWAAWGTLIEKHPYLMACVGDMKAVGERAGARWVCCGACSKAGHPHHPLYLRRDEPLREFDINAYLSRHQLHGQ